MQVMRDGTRERLYRLNGTCGEGEGEAGWWTSKERAGLARFRTSPQAWGGIIFSSRIQQKLKKQISSYRRGDHKHVIRSPTACS
jgi:hypothetical protein